MNTDFAHRIFDRMDRIYRIFSRKGALNAKIVQKCQKLFLAIQIDRPGPLYFKALHLPLHPILFTVSINMEGISIIAYSNPAAFAIEFR